jgi:hypothetical protein
MLGMGYLASAAGDDRREYMGTGTSYGVMKSFDTNFNRLVDARGLRHAIAEGQGDVTAPGYNSMRAMNIDPEGKSPEALGIEVMNTIRQNVKGKGRSEVGQYYHAKMLGGLSLNQEDVLRMSTESDENFEAFKKKHTKDTGDLDIQDPTMKRWQDLTVQFDTAWQTLKSGLLVGLEGLTPGVAALSRSLSESVATILKSDQVKLLMNAFGDGMKYVADNIDKESFRQGIKDFTDNIVVLSAKVIKALRLLHLIPGEVTEMGPPVSAGSMYQGDPTANKVWDAAGLPLTAGAGFLTAAVNATNRAAGPGGVMGMQQGWGNTLGGWIMNAGAKIDEWTGASVPLGKFAKQDMTDAEKVLMNTIINNETPGGGYRTEGKEFWDKDRRRMVHAVGRYQVMDYNVPAWTQELYGRSMTPEQFRADPLAQDTVALKRAMGYYQQTGNLADVLSKWHSGQLFADAVRMDLSDPNKTKTKDYVNKGLDYYARNSNGVVLQVSSSAAGNPVISASQMNLPAVGVPPLTLPGPPLFPGQIN